MPRPPTAQDNCTETGTGQELPGTESLTGLAFIPPSQQAQLSFLFGQHILVPAPRSLMSPARPGGCLAASQHQGVPGAAALSHSVGHPWGSVHTCYLSIPAARWECAPMWEPHRPGALSLQPRGGAGDTEGETEAQRG